MIDPILLAVLAVVAWLVAGEGAWGAATTFFSVVFAGFLTMMFFEPLSMWLGSNVMTSVTWQPRLDIIAFGIVFAIGVTLSRLAGEKIQKTDLDIESKSYDALRWLAGLATGYVTVAILLTALHTAPLQREFAGFTPERANMFGVAPDRQWLGFVQYASEWAFQTRNAAGQKRVFDGPEYALLPGQPAQRWASFPIRYATRRARLSGIPTAATASPTAAPGSGGDGGGGGAPATGTKPALAF